MGRKMKGRRGKRRNGEREKILKRWRERKRQKESVKREGTIV